MTRGIIPALAGNTEILPDTIAPGRDHPRSRGEYGLIKLEFHYEAGSSPLSRGIQGAIKVPIRVHGIIPALAGNTVWRHLRQAPVEDHPRSRGEYPECSSHDLLPIGSSPLSRGIRKLVIQPHSLARIIPALAGNTERCDSVPPRWWDHPRSRGEYFLQNNDWAFVPGSSPLSRGIPSSNPGFGCRARIIPALAGNTLVSPGLPPPAGDHPRSRGEYYI